MDNLLCAESIDDAPAGTCAIDLEKVKAEVEVEKIAKEIELYHHIKTYVSLLNKEASIEQAKLFIIASA